MCKISCKNCSRELKVNSVRGFCDTKCEGSYYGKKANVIDYSNGTCPTCNNEFKKKSTNHKYCSNKCKPKHGRNIEGIRDFKCTYCEKTFQGKNKKKYCSVECQKENNKKIYNESRECLSCGETYNVSRKDSARKYCSSECGYKKKKCYYCETEFKTRDSNKKYCNDFCRRKSVKKTHEQFTSELQSIHKGLIVPMELYKGSDYKMKFKCLQCNLEFEKITRQTIGSYKGGCPSCKRPSKGEDSVRDFLKKNKINFEEQKSFEGLKYLSTLFYDFAVYDSKENLECLIEFDGEQHFRSVEKWGGEEKLAETILRDEIKNNYASTNGINLLRISYKDINKIEEILECKFKETLLERG